MNNKKLFKWEYYVTGSKERVYHNIKEEVTYRTIALLYNKDLTKSEIEEYAQLIASAPELLDALQNLVSIFDSEAQSIYAFADEDIKKAKRAIKKATNN